MRLDHIGVAVKNASQAAEKLSKALGVRPYMEEVVESEGVKVVGLRIGEVDIELLEPLSEDTPVGRFLSKHGEGVHHIALAVEDIEKAMRRASEAGLKLLDSKPRTGARGRKVAFIHPKSAFGILLELVEG
ncbi:MAG: methylmalonyl-CoA epimerase [Thermoproteota archaeon]|nr:MAG: methylmalonyl-CoA epimerase [Candidatus Korarchaeota archaeon]RLG55813.1 MAG: methylmalonyl-CoA epimerase [Candidatus Korarchaeota archaeon]